MMRITKIMKNAIAFIMALLMVLSMGMGIYAEEGTEPVIHSGSVNLGDQDSYGGSIIIHKYDIAEFEKVMSEKLEVEITYVPYDNPMGKQLNEDSIVGYYELGDGPIEVTLGELQKLSDIVFKIEEVLPVIEDGKEGSLEPSDYTPVENGLVSYGRTVLGVMEWKGLERGYYRVSELENSITEAVIDDFIISIPMAHPVNDNEFIKEVHVYPKNKKREPNITKEIKANLENGNILTWEIKADIPQGIEHEKAEYKITDIMSKGLDIVRNNIKVFYKNDNNTVYLVEKDDIPTWDYTVEIDKSGNDGSTKLIIDLTQEGRNKLAESGEDSFYVVYDTVLNISTDDWAEIIADDIDNRVELYFKNSNDTEYTEGKDNEIVREYAGIEIIKQDGVSGVLLADAEFIIYTKLEDDVPVDPLTDADGEIIVLKTGIDGKASYGGLGKGMYYLVEEEPPTGYAELTGYVDVEIKEKDIEEKNMVKATILNYLDDGFTLPSTGGMGTVLFTLIGVVMVILAGGIRLASKKKEARNKGNIIR